MNCERLSDRMPGVMAGGDRWSREDEEHLVVCADCRSEWQLLARGAALGAELPALDASRIGADVQSRLAHARRADRNRRLGWIGLGLAAAAALVLVVARPDGIGRAPVGPIEDNALVLPVMELDSLSAEQLQAVLESMQPPLGTKSTLDLPSLQDLDDQQLERLLHSLEG
jgi:hypothetical protein